MSLIGYQNSRNTHQQNSFISLKIYKCDHKKATELEKKKCSNNTDEWLYDKIFEPYIFQQKFEFDNYETPISMSIERETGFKLDTS